MPMPQNRSFPKYWNIAVNPADRSGVIDLDGEIVATRPKDICGDVKEGVYYTNADFKNDLAACEGLSHVTVNINSVGGDLFLGIAIHNALRALPCKVTTVVRGIAASAASIIFCAGAERLVYPGSVLMVHGVSSMLDFYGFIDEHGASELITQLKAYKKSIQTMNAAVAHIYAATTGQDKDTCLALIADGAERYLNDEESIAEGWATGYAEDGFRPQLRMVAKADKTLLYSGAKLLSEDFRLPEEAAALVGITAGAEPNQETMNAENETTTRKDGGSSAAASAPDDVAAAVKADRERIARIDALAAKMGSSVNPALVAAAKYGAEGKEPMTPEAFAMAALEAMPADRFEASAHATARAEELAANKVPTAAASAGQDFPDINTPEARRDIIFKMIDKAAGNK